MRLGRAAVGSRGASSSARGGMFERYLELRRGKRDRSSTTQVLGEYRDEPDATRSRWSIPRATAGAPAARGIAA